MVAGGGYPRQVGRQRHVGVEEGAPGVNRIVADIGVAEVPVEQMKQRLLVKTGDGIDHVSGIGGVRPR